MDAIGVRDSSAGHDLINIIIAWGFAFQIPTVPHTEWDPLLFGVKSVVKVWALRSFRMVGARVIDLETGTSGVESSRSSGADCAVAGRPAGGNSNRCDSSSLRPENQE